MKIFITILCIASVTPIIGEEEAVSIQRELQKNNQIIKQKKKQERSILKELGTLRKNIYLTQNNSIVRTENTIVIISKLKTLKPN